MQVIWTVLVTLGLVVSGILGLAAVTHVTGSDPPPLNHRQPSRSLAVVAAPAS